MTAYPPERRAAMSAEQRRWTDAERERAAVMLRDGLSAGQMAPHFGMSRNAIIGRVHRDKLLSAIGFGKDAGGRKPKQSRIPGEHAAPKPAKQTLHPHNIVGKKEGRAFDPGAIEPVKVAPTVFECRAVPMMELKRGECRWAVNDAKVGEVHLFCGLPSGDVSYCDRHAARVYASRAVARAAA